MKIAILSESFFPVINGVCISTDILAEGLSARGHSVTVICPKNKKKFDDNSKNYNIIRTPSIISFYGYALPFPSQRFIFDALDKVNPDIVHCQIPFTYGHISYKWAKIHKIPYVSMCHTQYVYYTHYTGQIFSHFTRKYAISFFRKFYNRSDRVLCPSKMMKKELESYGISKDIYIIPTGIKLPKAENKEITLDIKKKFHINENDKVIIYLSRIAKEKNIYMLVDAFEQISKDYTDVKLMICGNGPEYKNLIKYVDSLTSRENIILTGSVEKSKVYDYLYCGDIFAFPSYTETQGLAVNEAMACGLGVVAVNAGGVPESIENNKDGILSSNNVNSFVQKLKELIDNEKLLKKIKENAKNKSVSFTTEKMIDEYEKLYKELLNE
ncbi:MAG: glycosyltransferase [Armatimonadetes bacterium]|nr:glycosyltransferase [Candidatus Hippobium faecium]